MDKKILEDAVQARLTANEAERQLAKYVFQTFYNALNHGQQKKVLEDEQVKSLIKLYDITVE